MASSASPSVSKPVARAISTLPWRITAGRMTKVSAMVASPSTISRSAVPAAKSASTTIRPVPV